jgi:hypothetical protein
MQIASASPRTAPTNSLLRSRPHPSRVADRRAAHPAWTTWFPDPVATGSNRRAGIITRATHVPSPRQPVPGDRLAWIR